MAFLHTVSVPSAADSVNSPVHQVKGAILVVGEGLLGWTKARRLCMSKVWKPGKELCEQLLCCWRKFRYLKELDGFGAVLL